MSYSSFQSQSHIVQCSRGHTSWCVNLLGKVRRTLVGRRTLKLIDMSSHSFFAIDLLNGEIFVRLCVWVANRRVEKGTSHEHEHPIGHPVLDSYPSSTILPLCPGERVPLAHRGKQCLVCPLKITQLVMPLDDESSSSTHHGMINRESPQMQVEGVCAMCQSKRR